jgi:hypothetical protein
MKKYVLIGASLLALVAVGAGCADSNDEVASKKPATPTEQKADDPIVEPKPDFAELIAEQMKESEIKQFCNMHGILSPDAELKAFAQGYGKPLNGVTVEEVYDELVSRCA